MARFRQLVFLGGSLPVDWYDTNARGYLSHVLVETDAGQLFPVTFYDPVRLAQSLGEEPVLAETGMIVVPSLTQDSAELAARILCEQGYFAYQQPMTRAEIDAAEEPRAMWPPRRQD